MSKQKTLNIHKSEPFEETLEKRLINWSQGRQNVLAHLNNAAKAVGLTTHLAQARDEDEPFYPDYKVAVYDENKKVIGIIDLAAKESELADSRNFIKRNDTAKNVTLKKPSNINIVNAIIDEARRKLGPRTVADELEGVAQTNWKKSIEAVKESFLENPDAIEEKLHAKAKYDADILDITDKEAIRLCSELPSYDKYKDSIHFNDVKTSPDDSWSDVTQKYARHISEHILESEYKKEFENAKHEWLDELEHVADISALSM